MRIAVVGCRGFLGASFSRFAAARGHQLLGFARSAQADPGLPGAFASADAAWADLAPALRDFAPDAVLHAAGTASVGASLRTPLDDLRGGLLTFANTLDAVRRANLDCAVLLPSSAAVYGQPRALPVAEDAALEPIAPYGFHKVACELLGREYAEIYGVRVIIARLFSLYGERQRRLLLWELYEQAVGPAPELVLQGTGDETRDYLHVDDAGAALLALAEAERAGAGPWIVNVASGVETRCSDLARRVIAEVAPGKLLRARGEKRPGDPARWVADVRRLEALGLAPPRPLADGVSECLAAWRRG